MLERKSQNFLRKNSGDTVLHVALGLVMLCCVAKMKGFCTGRVLELTLVDLDLINQGTRVDLMEIGEAFKDPKITDAPCRL